VSLLASAPAAQDTVAAPPDTTLAAAEPLSVNPTGLMITPRRQQSPEQQLDDQQVCYERTCSELAWDPYERYAELVAAGCAVELLRGETEREWVERANRGAVTGAIAGEILEHPGPGAEADRPDNCEYDADSERGAELGAAVAIAMDVLRSGLIDDVDDPAAKRAVSRFERELRAWERAYSHCLRQKGYRVSGR
jgi:hypothetical protein